MFWRILTGMARASITVHKSVTAIGLTVMIGVGVYDFMKARKARNEHNR